MRKREIKKRKKPGKRLFHRLTFWLGVIVIGTAVGITAQFGRAWVEPSATAPGGNIAAPINTGAVEQTKVGTATQKADICVDPTGTGNKICLGSGGASGGVPDGTITMWSGSVGSIPAGWLLCDGNHGTPDLRSRYIRGVSSSGNPGADGGQAFVLSVWPAGSVNSGYIDTYQLAYIVKSSATAGSTNLSGGSHFDTECTAAGGTVQTDGSDKFCKMNPVMTQTCTHYTCSGFDFNGTCFGSSSCDTYANLPSCPSGWSQYKNYTTTAAHTCNGTVQNSCPGATNVTTGQHAFGNTAPETRSYTNADWTPGSDYNCSYYGYDDYGNYTYFPQTCTTPTACGTSNSTCTADVTAIGCD